MKKYYLKVIYQDINPTYIEKEVSSKKEALDWAKTIFLFHSCISIFLFDSHGNLILKY